MGIIYNCAEYQPKENSLFNNRVWIFSNIANFKGMKMNNYNSLFSSCKKNKAKTYHSIKWHHIPVKTALVFL